ncbi:hypothetical protein O3P69_005367 [Scylla paramamosain]|uniref:Uncharacterized protein n=1 Tax=Scylla paramamosain TaxID=85552 RepID=A0AAW0U971_SCYPA
MGGGCGREGDTTTTTIMRKSNMSPDLRPVQVSVQLSVFPVWAVPGVPDETLRLLPAMAPRTTALTV